MTETNAGTSPCPEIVAAPSFDPRVAGWQPPGRSPQASTKSGNYVLRHWRGDLSLGTSYWINSVMVAAVTPMLFGLLLAQREDEGHLSLALVSTAVLACTAFSMVVQLWSTVGTVRAASRHRRRGGNGLLAALATVLSTLSLVGALLQVAGSVSDGQLQEHFALATGHDHIAAVDPQLAADGKTLLLLGALGSGSADRVDSALAKAPGVRLVHLASPGGRILEARRIAAAVRRRGLDTYVDGLCTSACTVVFLAGRDRGATPAARIGFHRSGFAGQDHLGAGDGLSEAYREAGLSPAFLARVQATPNRDMWFPTREELESNHVVTRLSLGGETTHDFAIAGIRSQADLRANLLKAPLWRGAEMRVPGTADRAAAAAWSVRLRGGTDGAAFDAARAVLSQVMPAAIATAPDAQLDEFARLFTDEARATLAVSPKACNDFLDGHLDGRAVLSPELLRRDQDVSGKIFASTPVSVRPASREALGLAITPVLRRLSADQLAIVRAPEKFRDQPRRRCEALIRLYDLLGQEPAASRAAQPACAAVDARRA